MTFRDLTIGDRFVVIATGVAYIVRRQAGTVPGMAERLPPHPSDAQRGDVDGPAVYETMLRADTPVRRVVPRTTVRHGAIAD